jgi:hypothetical protein
MAELDRILNPTRVSPASTACSACHIAEKLEHAVRSARKDVALPSSPSAYAPPANQNVQGTRVAEIGHANLHAFSYFGDQPSILTRVIHEAAASAAFVNSPAFRAGLTPGAQAAWDAAFGVEH